MNCPKCNQEMKKGYLFSTKDGAFSFANEVPGMMKNAKNEEGFIEITPIKMNHRAHVEAYCCENCRLVQFHYWLTLGKITLKKGLKRGVYKVNISVTDSGDEGHEGSEQTVAVKVLVK